MMEWPIVVATWLDAETEDGSVKATEYVRTYRPCVRKTTGHLIGEDETFIHLAMDDDRQNSPDHCQTITTIPKVLLRRPLEKYHPPVKRKPKKR